MSALGSSVANHLQAANLLGVVFSVAPVATIVALIFLWLIIRPQRRLERNARCHILWNIRKGEILWSPSATYLPQSAARQACEALEKRGLLEKDRLTVGFDIRGETRHLLADIIQYLFLRWLSFNASVACSQLKKSKTRRIELKDYPKELHEQNAFITSINNINPQSIIEAGLDQLSTLLPEDFSITMIADEPVKRDKNAFGIELKGSFGGIQVMAYPSAYTGVSSMRTGPSPSIGGMPIDSIAQDYFLEQFGEIAQVSFYLTFRASFNEFRLVFQPSKAQEYIDLAWSLGESFYRHFDWYANASRAGELREAELYEVVKTIEKSMERLEADVSEIRKRIEKQNDSSDTDSAGTE